MYYDVGPVFLSPLHNPHPLLVQLSQDIRHQLDPNNGYAAVEASAPALAGKQ
ncbi:hypothetical protein VD0004_g567 [Verticillium dahliae]|nr:hypothetical protein VD0004_g567 [Verticillium dahliae]